MPEEGARNILDVYDEFRASLEGGSFNKEAVIDCAFSVGYITALRTWEYCKQKIDPDKDYERLITNVIIILNRNRLIHEVTYDLICELKESFRGGVVAAYTELGLE